MFNLDKPGETVNQATGFTATGAGQDQEWPVDILHGLPLAGI